MPIGTASAAAWVETVVKDNWLNTRRICPLWSKTDRSSTPKDMETTYGLTGGHIFHGELALDQFFTMRPLLDWARYNTPIQNLYLCGSGTHPGAGLTAAQALTRRVRVLKQLASIGLAGR